jgi:hypothetical protein
MGNRLSFKSWWEDVGKLFGLFGEGRLHDDAVDVLEVGDLLERVVFGVVFEDFVERVADEQRVFEFGEFSEFVKLVPALDPIVCVETGVLPIKSVVSFMHIERP